MRRFINDIIVLVISGLTFSFLACGDGKNPPDTSDTQAKVSSNDTLIYNHVDASIPPDFHRSYMIRVTPGQVYLTIDVYGDIIARDSSAITRNIYDAFVTALDNLHIKSKKELETEGCTGGTTDKFALFIGGSKEVKGYTYHCDNKESGDLEGDIGAAANLFKGLVPGLQQKIDATRKN